MRVYRMTQKSTSPGQYWTEQEDGKYRNPKQPNKYLTQSHIDLDLKNGFVELVGYTISVPQKDSPFKAVKLEGAQSKPFKKATKSMSMTIDGRLATYIDGVVKYTTKYGAEIEVRHPESWAITRVAQFMESLLKTELV